MPRNCPHCGASHPHNALRCSATGLPVGGDPRLVGATVAGRYHLVRLLGDGGMGAVYKAADQVLRRFVAIKLLHLAAAQNAASVERFEREARAAAGIGHPNIIEVLDFGRADGVPYLVMEYLRGRSLAHLIHSEGKLPIDRACAIATHALAGLAAAHDRGILHRDLKPANLMLIAHLGDRDFVKICDFGFAALLTPQERIDDASKPLTPARTLVGTPAYAAPERLRGDDRRDPRVDVYAVGVVLFEMLTGKRPFEAPTFAELARKVRNEPAPDLRSMRPDAPAALERVIARALAKEPEQRWDDAATLAAALVPFGGRIIPVYDDQPSDSFTMDLLKIRARETNRRRIPAMLPLAPDKREVKRETGPEIPIEVATEGVADDTEPPDPSATTRRARPPSSGSRSSAARGSGARSAGSGSQSAEALRETPPTEPVMSPIIQVPDAELPRPIASAPVSGTVAMADRLYAGSAIVAILRFVARRFGERSLKQVLEDLSPQSREVFDRGIAPDQWVPFEIVSNLVEAIDRRLGRDDLHLVVECGRAVAESAVDPARISHTPPPELVVAEIPTMGRRLVRGVDYVVRRVGRGYGRIELVESGTPSVTGCVATLGFIDRSLERVGALDVEVNLLSCRALGDPNCLFDISWLT